MTTSKWEVEETDPDQLLKAGEESDSARDRDRVRNKKSLACPKLLNGTLAHIKVQATEFTWVDQWIGELNIKDEVDIADVEINITFGKTLNSELTRL